MAQINSGRGARVTTFLSSSLRPIGFPKEIVAENRALETKNKPGADMRHTGPRENRVGIFILLV